MAYEIFDNDTAFVDQIKVTPESTIILYVDTSKTRFGDVKRIVEGLKGAFSDNKILVLPDVCRIESADVDDLKKIRDILGDVIKERNGNCE